MLSHDIREQIERHIAELYFPYEVNASIIANLTQMLEDYILKAYPGSNHESNTSKPYRYNIEHFGLYMPTLASLGSSTHSIIKDCSLTPSVVPVSTLLKQMSFVEYPDESKLTYFNINSGFIVNARCPISGFKETVEALESFLVQREKFLMTFDSELLRYGSIKAFLKVHPNMKASLAPFIEDEIVDLPAEVDINMTTLASSVGAIAV